MNAATPGFGLYLHWPWCRRLCPYCDFNIVRHRGGDHADLLAAIIADMRGHGQRVQAPGPLGSLSLGGGTPSLMTPQQVQQVIEAADQVFGLAQDCEISIEANPDALDETAARDFAAAGINRFSIGVQSLDDAALRFLGRDHDAAQARQAVAAALGTGARVSADFIYGLPEQGVQDWCRGLDAALALGLEHYSFYALTIEPGTAFGVQRQKGRLTPLDEDRAAALFALTQERCAAAGLPSYEVSNHARSIAAQSRHNLLYWRNQDWIGVGPGAHGRAALDGRRHALTAARKPQDYIDVVARTGWGVAACEALSGEAIATEGLAMGLRLREGVDLARLKTQTGFAPDPGILRALQDEGWLETRGGHLRVSENGRALTDRLVLELLA